MKFGQAKWVSGTWLMVAREAARRFAYGHGSAAGRRVSWRPLFLRWRQRRRHYQDLRAGRPAAQAPAFWSPQFHFHFATYLSNRRWRDRASGPARSNTILETRVVPEEHRQTKQDERSPRPQLRAHRPVRPFYIRQRPQTQTDAGVSLPTGSTQGRSPRPSASPAARRPQTLLSGETPRVFRVSTLRQDGAQPFQTQSRIWQHSLQIFRARSRFFSNRFPDDLPEHKALRLKFDVIEELVWRRAKRPPAEVATFDREQASLTSFDRSAPRTFQGHDLAKSVSAVERVESPPITSLDPSLLDRVTEDVIRRVEQRVRIERERRGL